jgi:Rhodopirellula transposase DDE domain
MRQGLGDLEEAEEAAAGRLRKKGAAARSVPSHRRLSQRISATYLQECTAGEPLRAGGRWTHLSLRAFSRRRWALGPPASRRTMRRWRRKRQLGGRPARPQKPLGPHPDRNAPCATIARLRREDEASGAAVLASDTQKPEWLGNFHRAGTPCTAETVATVDHDCGSAGQGTLMPHGISAMVPQHAPRPRNTSHDTRALWCDSVAWWWEHAGRAAPPEATRLLVLGDGGGSTSATHSLFQEALQGLAKRLGLEMRVAHSPPYCSKDTPLAHRVFPHSTRACPGGICHTVESARQCIARAHTATGLRVTVRLLDTVDHTGRKCAADFKHHMKIVFDDYLPKWNDRAVPECT